MSGLAAVPLRALLLAAGLASTLAAMPAPAAARADCDWAWHCERSGACGFVPFCDAPTDKPPPLRGARLPADTRRTPLPPDPHAKRKPLPGFKPIPAPPAAAPPGAPPPPGAQPGQGRGGARPS